MPKSKSWAFLLGALTLDCTRGRVATQQEQPPVSVDPGACVAGHCGARCTDGAVECRGDAAAACRDGFWVETACAIGCAEGHCVVCRDGERGCADEITAEACLGGARVRTACGEGTSCADGRCICPEGAIRCTDGGRQRCAAEAWSADPCSSDRPVCYAGGACGTCRPGIMQCLDADTSQSCTDSGSAEAHDCAEGCDPSTGACRPLCRPGARHCRGQSTIVECAGDGQRYFDVATCDSAQAEVCSYGQCIDACGYARDTLSPAGCTLYAPPLYAWDQRITNQPASFYPNPSTRLYLLNPNGVAATATVDEGSRGTVQTLVVPAAGGVTIDLLDEVKWANQSVITPGGTIAIRSDLPIYAVQHLDQNDGFENAETGDTAFLLPSHLLETYGHRYRVITQEHRVNHAGTGNEGVQPGGFIVASTSHDADTNVTFTFKGTTAAGASGAPPSYTAGTTVTRTLGPRETIHFLSWSPMARCPGSSCTPQPDDNLTGTLVTSDHPVAVFNGGMSRLPWIYLKHIQAQLLEQLMPVDLWGDDFLLVARSEKHEQWVAVTDTDQTELTFDPRPPAAPSPEVLAAPGDNFRFSTAYGNYQDHRQIHLATNAPILLARYFYIADGRGGSTYSLERPTRFWRSSYAIQSADDSTNKIMVVVPTGNSITVDGSAVTGPYAPGPLGHETAEMFLDKGPHVVTSTAKFGLLVYGFSDYAGIEDAGDSYAYMGPVGFGDAFSP